MRVTVLKFGQPTVTGRIYSSEDTRFPSEGFIFLRPPEEVGRITLNDSVIGQFKNMAVEGHDLRCDVSFLKSEDDTLSSWLATSGTGMVEVLTGEAVVTDAEIACLFVTKETDA